jgi:hypothetical protein
LIEQRTCSNPDHFVVVFFYFAGALAFFAYTEAAELDTPPIFFAPEPADLFALGEVASFPLLRLGIYKFESFFCSSLAFFNSS